MILVCGCVSKQGEGEWGGVGKNNFQGNESKVLSFDKRRKKGGKKVFKQQQ